MSWTTDKEETRYKVGKRESLFHAQQLHNMNCYDTEYLFPQTVYDNYYCHYRPDIEGDNLVL